MNPSALEQAQRAQADSAVTPSPPPRPTVSALSTTPVKGLRMLQRREIALSRFGVADDRRFYLVDKHGRMINGKLIGSLSQVQAVYDSRTEELTLTFPGGLKVSDSVRFGGELETRFFSRTPRARLVVGGWAEALSQHTGTELRLVAVDSTETGVDRGRAGAVTFLSDASLAQLEAEAGGREIDARRFRMSIQVAGTEAHEEDEWVGRVIEVGGARVALHGHVGRCLVTSRCPESGSVDLPTLELLAYRRQLPTTERLAFGVYGEVITPGRVRLGDAVLVAEPFEGTSIS